MQKSDQRPNNQEAKLTKDLPIYSFSADFDQAGKEIRRFQGDAGAEHVPNFVKALRSRSGADHFHVPAHRAVAPKFSAGGIRAGFCGRAVLWLALYLPEIFPMHVRATGAGLAMKPAALPRLRVCSWPACCSAPLAGAIR